MAQGSLEHVAQAFRALAVRQTAVSSNHVNVLSNARPLPFGRRTFYRLPIFLQTRLRRAKRALLRQEYWAASVKRLRLKEHDYIAEAERVAQEKPGRKRVAIYGLHHFSPVEYGLAKALRLRGHDVRGILCDGLLPLCELSLGPNVRPPCHACVAALSHYEDAFGFSFDRLTDYLTQEDRSSAEALVDGTRSEDLHALTVQHVPVGLFARRELQRYYRGFVFAPERDPAYRDWLVAGVLLVWLAERWLDRHQPDILGMCSGRTLSTAGLFAVARRRGIPVVTWDGAATHPDTLTFSHNLSATEIPLDQLWVDASRRALSPAEVSRLTSFMKRWSSSEATPFPYNPSPMEDEARIAIQLGLRRGAPLVVAYTNTSWDIAVIDRDAGFASMFDWLFSFVRSAIDLPHMDFVVRAHPAERKVPQELWSRTPVCREIRRRFSALPANLALIEPDNSISSYALASMASVNMVYASRFGLEVALAGRRPWIAGNVTYRGKGFTRDITSSHHMRSLLEAGGMDDQLSEEEVSLAQRFAYLWFFRYEVRLPILRPADRRFRLHSFEELTPAGDAVLSRVCDRFISGEPFLDLNHQASTQA